MSLLLIFLLFCSIWVLLSSSYSLYASNCNTCPSYSVVDLQQMSHLAYSRTERSQNEKTQLSHNCTCRSPKIRVQTESELHNSSWVSWSCCASCLLSLWVLDIHTYLADVWTSAQFSVLAQLKLLGHLFGMGFFAHLMEACFSCGEDLLFRLISFTLLCNLSMDTLRVAFEVNMDFWLAHNSLSHLSTSLQWILCLLWNSASSYNYNAIC